LNFLKKIDYFEIAQIEKKYPDYYTSIFSNMIIELENINIEYYRLNFELEKNRYLYEFSDQISYKNKVNALEKKIEILQQKQTSEIDIESESATLEAYFKTPFDIYKMSTKRYFKYRENYIKHAENN